MQLDIALESRVGADAFRELGLLAEQFGFRAIWAQNYARGPEPFMTAMPLAMAATRIHVGVAVVCPMEMHPARIANAVLTLNEYARGRAAVVVTSGGEWPGIINLPGGRVDPTREALQIIRAALGDKGVNVNGDYYTARGFGTSWKTTPPPALYAGAHGPKMLRMAAGFADGIMLSDIQPEMFDGILPDVREAMHGAPTPQSLSNFVAWHVRKDREESIAEARRELIIRGWLRERWIAPYLDEADMRQVLDNPMPFLWAYRNRTSDIEGVPERISNALVEGLTLSGDERDIDRHIERLRKYADAGFTEIVLGLQDNPTDAIRMIGERVLPALK